MKSFARICALVLVVVSCALGLSAQTKRKVIIDQDAAGPGGTDMQAILSLVNSPETQVLGITVLTGDAWRDISSCEQQGVHREVGDDSRKSRLPGRVEFWRASQSARANGNSTDARGQALDPGGERGCRAFHGPDGAAVSA